MAQKKEALGTFGALLSVSDALQEPLQRINQLSLNILGSNRTQLINSIGLSTPFQTSNMQKFLRSIAMASEEVSPAHRLQGIALDVNRQFSELFKSVDLGVSLSDSMKKSLIDIQTGTLMQLSLCYDTSFIRDLTRCFTQASYHELPKIINFGISQPIIGASDVAFLKTSKLVTILDTELQFPRGFKTSIQHLRNDTADDLADNGDISYDTKTNRFISADSSVKSSEMNVLCAGRKLMTMENGDELFSESELADFQSCLSRTPMLALTNDVGKRILEWISYLKGKQSYQTGFEKSVYYHSRNRKCDTAPFTADLMMKAPHGLPGTGRFNHAGRAHFYFADTEQGAKNEVKKYLSENEVTQTIKLIPIKPITLLDLSGTITQCKVFLRYIRFSLDNTNDKTPREYLIPCFVADCCYHLGYDGIKYKGSKEYSNFVTWDDGYFRDGGMC